MTPGTGVSACWLVVSVALCGTTRVHSQGPLFVRGTDVPVGAGPGQVVLTDVNRDGRLDILTANGTAYSFGMLFGDGQGRFTVGPTVRRDSPGGRQALAVAPPPMIARAPIASRSATSTRTASQT